MGPLLVVLGALAVPASRTFLVSFFKPPPLPTSSVVDSGPPPPKIEALPRVVEPTGAESIELRTLLQDAPSSAHHPVIRGKRTALFGTASLDARPPTTRPAGLHRPGILTRDDPRIDSAMLRLVMDKTARENFISAVKHSGRWSADISKILKEWRVPDELQAIIYVESAFVPTVCSDDGCGLWQLTPDVAHVYGLAMLPTYDERRGIAAGTGAAAHYLFDLRERLGTWELAILAYNVGYKATLDELAKHATTNYWDIVSWLPRELSDYVAQVLGTAYLLANLDRFGFDTVKREEPVTTSALDVPNGVTFALLAKTGNISVASLRTLNPEYSDDAVPATSFPMVVHVPAGTYVRMKELLPLFMQGGHNENPVVHDQAAAQNHEVPVVSIGLDKRIFYKVKEGDTLASLSRRYGTAVEIIASDNAIDPTTSLQPGKMLAIRVADTPPPPANQ